MNHTSFQKRGLPFAVAVAMLWTAHCFAQAPAPAASTGRAAAPTEVDFTGYWVSLVTEDWRWRMVTPAKGDYQSVPITEAARIAADKWDPAKDEAAGEQCRSYGAPTIMRVPERLHITWQDDNTLKVETDAGQQIRLLHFGNWKAPGGAATWQGDSVATWQTPRTRGGGAAPPKYGNLKIVTTHIRPGYLRKNGLLYSANTELTEYWDLNKEPNGNRLLVVTSVVHDPAYLAQDWITSPHFQKEPDGSKWDPQPCSARW